MNIVVTGAGGMIGGHLVNALVEQGHKVVALDIKALADWWQVNQQARNLDVFDCLYTDDLTRAFQGKDRVYHLAEDMGGIGFIETHRVQCAESVKIGISALRAASDAKVPRFFFSSSACAYNTTLQNSITPQPLRETDAWPAQPEEGYGLAKLFIEELCRHYQAERGLQVRIARYHNVYGTHGAWEGGREKAPAALCRKVAEAFWRGRETIEIWGIGWQSRSYLHVSDCVRGTIALMESNHPHPVNIGSDQLVTVDELVSLIEEASGFKPERTYNMRASQGVMGRNADISLAKSVLGWHPTVSLQDGIAELYAWVSEEVKCCRS